MRLSIDKLVFIVSLIFFVILGFFIGAAFEPLFVHADTITNCLNSNPAVLGGMQNTDCFSYQSESSDISIGISPSRKFLYITMFPDFAYAGGSEIASFSYFSFYNIGTLDPCAGGTDCYVTTETVGGVSGLSDGSYSFNYFGLGINYYPAHFFNVVDGKFYLNLSDIQSNSTSSAMYVGGFSYGEAMVSLLLLLILTTIVFHTFWVRIFGTKLSVPFYRSFLGNNSKEGKEIKNI